MVIVTFMILFFLSIQLTDTTSARITYDDVTINWHLETIDDSNDSQPGRTSIAVDNLGGVHVSYHDDVIDGLRYAYRHQNGSWSTQNIDDTGVGNYSEIGVDSEGKVHIAYEDHTNGSLKYAVKLLTGEWIIDIVDPGPRTGGFPTLDIDGDDKVIITYLDRATPSIKMAVQDGASWSISDIIVAEHLYWGEIDLAIDDNGSMYMVYLAGIHPRYLQGYYAHRWPGEEWRPETEPFTESSVNHLSIAIDESGLPTIAANGGHSIHVRLVNGRWVNYPYFEEQEFRDFGDIAYDSHGDYIICGQTASGNLRFVQRTPPHLIRAGFVDGLAGTGLFASMAVDHLDWYHIVYYDETNGWLVYATDINRPSEPLDLRATGGERDILLEWEMPTHLGNATSVTFNIYRDRVGRSHYDLYVTGLTGTSFLDTGVYNRAYYHYWVVAVNGAGEGQFSTMVYDRAFLYPTTPQNITATAGPDNVVLNWEPPEDPGRYTLTGYRIHWRSGTTWSGMGPEWQYPLTEWSNITVDGSTRSFNHTNLSLGYTYHYEIVAFHADGEGEMSEDIWAIPMEPPDKPTELAAYRLDGRVIVNWTRPVDDGGCRLTAYKVYRGTSHFNLQLLTTINGTPGDWNLWNEPTLDLVDDGTVPEFISGGWGGDWDYICPRDEYDEPGEMDNSITYYYQVSAVQLAGEGSRSDILEVPPEGTPNPPQDLEVQVVDGGVKLTWRRPIDDGSNAPKGYVIYRADENGNVVGVDMVSKANRHYVDRELVSNSTYTYYVRGVNDEGQGMSSNMEEVTVGVIDPKDEPSSVDDDREALYLFIGTLALVLVVGIIIWRRGRSRGDR